jgi:DNA-binding NarL/FixJ family response regulator
MVVNGTDERTCSTREQGASQKRPVRRVFIVDDHPVVRLGLRRIMENEADMIVCGEAESAQQARSALKELTPDAILIDISLKGGDGIELLKSVRAQYPALPILVVSIHDESIYAERLVAAGANGYIMKQASGDEFLLALRAVLDGRIYVSGVVRDSLLSKMAGREAAGGKSQELSIRELQVLRMIGSGLSTREIGRSLNLSAKTIESHKQRLKWKLKLDSGAKLLQYAIAWSGQHRVLN